MTISTNQPVLCSKNERIKNSIKTTRGKRKHQRCKVYQLKVDKSHLSNQRLAHLNSLFLQAKWFINAVIASNKIFEFDSKVKEVLVKVGEKYELRSLSFLSSQMKQGLLKQVQQDIINLAKKKEKGYKVGKLKFKKCIQTIPLKQYDNTYYIQNDTNRIRIQGLKKWMRVRGLKQIPDRAELANAQLINRHGDFFLHVTTYLSKTHNPIPSQSIGLDFGLKHQLTLSNAIQINYDLPISRRIRKLYRQLSKNQPGSHNYLKSKQALQKEYARWINRKKDVTNKLTSILTRHHQYICLQDDPIANWQRLWGSKVLNTNLGAFIAVLKKRTSTPCIVDPWTATTKRCANCSYVLKASVPLTQRRFICPNCGYTVDRDVNAAQSIEQLGLYSSDVNLSVPAGRREVTPPEMHTTTQTLVDLFNQVSYVRASIVDERGSPIASA